MADNNNNKNLKDTIKDNSANAERYIDEKNTSKNILIAFALLLLLAGGVYAANRSNERQQDAAYTTDRNETRAAENAVADRNEAESNRANRANNANYSDTGENNSASTDSDTAGSPYNNNLEPSAGSSETDPSEEDNMNINDNSPNNADSVNTDSR